MAERTSSEFAPIDGELLKTRVEGIKQSLQRARFALVLGIIVSGTVLTTIWNEYFTWDAILFDPDAAALVAQSQQASAPQKSLYDAKSTEWAKNYVDNWTISIAPLGIRISGSDLSVFGCLALVLFSLYWCVCARRSNHEIGSLFLDLDNAPDTQRRIAYYGMRSDLVFTASSNDDRAYTSVLLEAKPASDPILRSVLLVLPYLPSITAVLVLLSDVYFGMFYADSGVRRWLQIPPGYRTRLVVFDLIGLFLLFFLLRFNRSTFRYMRGIGTLAEQFRKDFQRDFGTTLGDGMG